MSKKNHKEPFTIVGVKRRFQTENCYEKIPEFWDEWKEEPNGLKGIFGFCQDMNDRNIDYWIADLYEPWNDIPEGFETAVIPGGLWAEFICRGPLPESLQNVNTQIWSQWVPSLKEYAIAGNYSFEVYGPPEDTVCFIWVPLKAL